MLIQDDLHRRVFWNRSRNGNLTRMFLGMRLTVFLHKERYSWCIADDQCGVEYSHSTYYTEDDAIDALKDKLFDDYGME